MPLRKLCHSGQPVCCSTTLPNGVRTKRLAQVGGLAVDLLSDGTGIQ